MTDDQVRHMARGGNEIVDEGDVGRDLAQDRLRKEKCFLAPTPVTGEVEEGEVDDRVGSPQGRTVLRRCSRRCG